MPKTDADRNIQASKPQREHQEEAMRATTPLPLSALLSHLLVAFTIEFDNEFEHQMPHRTTNHGSTTDSRHAPWLVSLVMWSNCMQFVGEEGVTVRELKHLARTETNLDGMRRWGYIDIEPVPTDSRPKRLRPTPAVQRHREAVASTLRHGRDQPASGIAMGADQPVRCRAA